MTPSCLDDDARPIAPLTERWLIPHPFACATYACRRPIVRARFRPYFEGWCDEHHHGRGSVRVSIWGRMGEGWCEFPMGARLAAELRARGAFDADGRTRPFAEWQP